MDAPLDEAPPAPAPDTSAAPNADVERDAEPIVAEPVVTVVRASTDDVAPPSPPLDPDRGDPPGLQLGDLTASFEELAASQALPLDGPDDDAYDPTDGGGTAGGDVPRLALDEPDPNDDADDDADTDTDQPDDDGSAAELPRSMTDLAAKDGVGGGRQRKRRLSSSFSGLPTLAPPHAPALQRVRSGPSPLGVPGPPASPTSTSGSGSAAPTATAPKLQPAKSDLIALHEPLSAGLNPLASGTRSLAASDYLKASDPLHRRESHSLMFTGAALGIQQQTQSQILNKLNLHAMYQQAKAMVGAKNGKLTPAEWWRFAILSVMRVVRALGGFNISVLEALEQSTQQQDKAGGGAGGAGGGGARGPEFRLQDYVSRPTFIISPDIRQTLDKHRSEYTEEDFAMIERLTERMPSFQKYSPEVRRKLCHSLQYEVFGPGRIMVKQGHDPKSFYFILNGNVQVFKYENDVRIDLNDLSSGDSFGELALLKGTKRTASVKCTTRTEFFRIDKDDFLDVLKNTAEEDIQSKLEFFQAIPFLSDISPANLNRLAELCSKRKLPTNSVIVRERESLNAICMIRSGSVRILRIVPFRKVPRSNARYSLEPCPMPEPMAGTAAAAAAAAHQKIAASVGAAAAASLEPGAMPSRPIGRDGSTPMAAASGNGGDVICKLLCTGFLGAGQYFGQECVLASLERRKGINAESPSAAANGANPAAPTPASNNPTTPTAAAASAATASLVGSPHSIVTCEPTEILRISKVDFLKLMTPRALSLMEMQDREARAAGFGTPLAELQAAFIHARRWAHFRTKVLGEIVVDKETRRERKIRELGLSGGSTARKVGVGVGMLPPVRSPERGGGGGSPGRAATRKPAGGDRGAPPPPPPARLAAIGRHGGGAAARP
ncbi:hypothetical protein H9P43_009327 [Blastocladiella emersonii ATCC 22665]|nr:hypothetical protein H9P43_009327 [Blastocladiella emersonii ATCC 22665]